MRKREITSRRCGLLEMNTAIEEFGRKQLLSQWDINGIQIDASKRC